MPVVVEVVEKDDFDNWVAEQGGNVEALASTQ